MKNNVKIDLTYNKLVKKTKNLLFLQISLGKELKMKGKAQMPLRLPNRHPPLWRPQ
jgi:hypothetical protein